MRNTLFILLTFLSTLKLLASDSRFYNISDIFGVPVRQVFSICKDANGFIWGASKTGVIRISENDCRTYNLPYNTSNNYFTKIVCKNNMLIAYTNNGQFFSYNELYDRFDPLVDIRHILNEDYINLHNAIICNDESIWIGSVNGLYKYDNGNLTGVLPENNIQALELYDETRILVATTLGIGLLDINTQEYNYFNKYKNEGEMEASSLFYDNTTGLIWVGTISSGLFCYKTGTTGIEQVSTTHLPEQPILTIKKNSKTSTMLIGIDGQGLWELSEDGNNLISIFKEDVNDPYSLHGDGVYDVLLDEERIWVATYTGGLSYIDQRQYSINQIIHQINQPNSLINNYVNKVLEDNKGDMWFATNGGVSRWNRKENKWYSYLQNTYDHAKVFLALCEDNNGNIWAGTYSSGVYLLDGKIGKLLGHYFEKEDENGVSGKFISDIYKDTEGNIWMGGTRNVICYIEKEKQFRIYDQKPLYAFEEISPGKLLMACTYGLLSLDKTTGASEVLVNNVLAQDIIIIGNNVWIATSGEGLIRYDIINRTTEKFTTQSGLLSNYINSIIYSEDNLWLGTEKGLCRFSLKDNKSYTYPNTFPLSSISFNTNSSWNLKDGSLIWGTNKGAIIIKPDMLEQKETKARIFVQDISISGGSIRKSDDLLNGVPVDKSKQLNLNYKQNNFVLELLPIGLNSTGTRFSWKMEGIDNEWSQPTDLRFVTYTNLPNGNYKLNILMYDSTLLHIIDERVLSVNITPPFWETWWFRLTGLILAIGLIVYSLRAYSNNLKQKHAKDKIRFFTNMAHDIRTSLTLISAPVEQLKSAPELTQKSRYYINLAADQSGRLSSVATQLLDFEKVDSGKGQLFPVMADVVQLVSKRCQIFKTTAEKRKIQLQFTSNSETYITAIDEIKIEKVVDNLISNAIKYSHAESKVEINLNCQDKQWSLEVKDYGLGISENAQQKLFKEFYRGDNKANSRMVGSGIGLLLVKNYVTMHEGEITFDSKENAGSSFRIIIPYQQTTETTIATDSPVSILQEAHVLHEDLFVDVIKDSTKNKVMHVLIAEDNADLQEFLFQSLGEHYKVTKAIDGEEAWKLIQKENPDLVISDIIMPNMDGFELCKLIKSTFETSHIPVILLTSLSQKAKQLEGLGLGADDYITKPFDINLLIQRIKSIIKNREIVREKAFKLINQQDEPVYANELNDQFVKKALEVVWKNITNCEFGKDEFASDMHVSPSLLYQKLKSLTGQSPIDFIRSIRFNHAMELLQTHKYTITEVSEMCGFSSANYFSTAFKKHFGKPPIEV